MADINEQVNQLITQKGEKNYIEESAKIPHFYDDKKVDTITPKEFLEKVQQIVDNHRIANPNDIVKRIALALRGNAYRWFTALSTRNAIPATFEAFKIIFAKEYKVILTPYVATAKLLSLNQKKDQSVAHFHTDCTLVVDDIFKNVKLINMDNYNLAPMPDYNAGQVAVRDLANVDAKAMANKVQMDTLQNLREHMILNHFVNGLLPAYRDKVMAKSELDHEQLRDYAIELENIANCNHNKQPEASSSQAPISDDMCPVRNGGNQQQQQQQYQNNSWRGNNSGRGNQSGRGYQNNGYRGGSNSQNWRGGNQGNKYNQNRGGYQGNNQAQRYGSNSQRQVICWFCNVPGHIQTKCRNRIAAKSPLVNKQNKVFTINGKSIIPENGMSKQEVHACVDAELQGFFEGEDFP